MTNVQNPGSDRPPLAGPDLGPPDDLGEAVVIAPGALPPVTGTSGSGPDSCGGEAPRPPVVTTVGTTTAPRAGLPYHPDERTTP
jgi:hypothetical protein